MSLLLKLIMVLFLLSPCLAEAVEISVAGRILTDSGPLVKGRVYAYKNHSDIQAGKPSLISAPADRQGRYRLQLPPGEYYFVARGEKEKRDFFAYHGNNPIKVDSGNAWVTLMALEAKRPVYSEGATGLKGVVTFKGKPVKGAFVTLYRPEAKHFKGLGFRTESVEPDGSFNLAVPEGKYVVVAKLIESGKGVRPLKAGDLFCYHAENPVTVRADEATSIELPCYPKDDRTAFLKIPGIRPDSFKTLDSIAAGITTGISGKVTDSDGKPVGGLMVMAYRATKPVFLTYHLSHGTEYSAETAADGSYFIPVDVGGDYYLVARNTLGDGPHRGDLYGLYNGNSRHVVAYQEGKRVDGVNISVSRIMDEPMQKGAEEALPIAATSAADLIQEQVAEVVTDRVIAVDTVWKGRVNIKGVVVVKKGATLTLLPGTVVAFSRIDRDNNGVGDGELRVEGRIVARGTSEERIVFTSAESKPQVRDWSYIHLLASQADNLFEQCRFEYGFSGIQAHYSNLRVSDSYFNNNYEGLHFNTANVTAEHNTLVNNSSAIRFKRLEGKITLSNNDIRKNEIGVLFGRQQINAVDFKALNRPIEFPTFTDNNIDSNDKYNFSMGEGQNLDINMAGNWWGSASSEKIEESIFDHDSDQTLGRVHYKPFLTGAVCGSGIRDTVKASAAVCRGDK